MKKFLLLLAVSYIPGEGVGDSPHGTIAKGLFARYSRMVDFSVVIAL